jgi:hypothetical protein
MWERIVQRRFWLMGILLAGVVAVLAGQRLFGDAVCQRLYTFALYSLAIVSVIVTTVYAIVAPDDAPITILVTMGVVVGIILLIPMVSGPFLTRLPEVQAQLCPDPCSVKIAQASKLRLERNFSGAESLIQECINVAASPQGKEAVELELARTLYDKARDMIEARQCGDVMTALDQAYSLASKYAAGADLAHAIQERKLEAQRWCATPTPTPPPTVTRAPTVTPTPTVTPIPRRVEILRWQQTTSDFVIDFEVWLQSTRQPDLPKSAFSVSVGDADVPIQSFEEHTDNDPVCVIAVVDDSGSIRDKGGVPHIQKALETLNNVRKPQDQLGLILFGSKVQTQFTQPPSTTRFNPDVVTGGSGNTALWDGVLEGLTQTLKCDPTLPRYLIVLTDGEDNSSDYRRNFYPDPNSEQANKDKAEHIKEMAQEKNIGICTVGIRGLGFQEKALQAAVYGCPPPGYRSAADYVEVASLFDKIFRSMRHFYRIRFSPDVFSDGQKAITLHVQGGKDVTYVFGQ